VMMESPFRTSVLNLTELSAYLEQGNLTFGPPFNFTTPDPSLYLTNDNKTGLITIREVSEQDDTGSPVPPPLLHTHTESQTHLDSRIV
jgi:hypothetical protein